MSCMHTVSYEPLLQHTQCPLPPRASSLVHSKCCNMVHDAVEGPSVPSFRADCSSAAHAAPEQGKHVGPEAGCNGATPSAPDSSCCTRLDPASMEHHSPCCMPHAYCCSYSKTYRAKQCILRFPARKSFFYLIKTIPKHKSLNIVIEKLTL